MFNSLKIYLHLSNNNEIRKTELAIFIPFSKTYLLESNIYDEVSLQNYLTTKWRELFSQKISFIDV